MGPALPAIAIGATVASGALSIAQGFAQAGLQRQQAAVQTQVAQNNFYTQKNAVQRLEQEQAEQATAQTSTRLAMANRNLATLAVVMGERGLSSASFTGLLNDVGNSASLDTARISANYANETEADSSRIEAANQDYLDTKANAAATSSASSTGAWLNAFGTTLRIGSGIAGQQLQLQSLAKSREALLAASKGGVELYGASP